MCYRKCFQYAHNTKAFNAATFHAGSIHAHTPQPMKKRELKLGMFATKVLKVLYN